MPCAPLIGLTGQFSAVDGLFTGEENLRLMADLRHLGRDGGPAARRRAARALRPRRRGEEARRDLLRRHAAAARPRDDARRRPTDHLPRRADVGPRSAQPARDVGHHPRARRGRRDDLPHDPGPRRGRPPRPPDRGPRPRARSSPRAPRTSSSAWSPAGTSGWRSPTPRSSIGPPGSSRTAPRDEEALTLQVPSDGGTRSLRALLDRLDAAVDRRRRARGPDPRSRRRLPVPHRRPRHCEKEAVR